MASIIIVILLITFGMPSSGLDCSTEKSSKVYPYIFGMNSTATNQTNRWQDKFGGLQDVSIENVITDSSLDSYVALTASTSCYFDGKGCFDESILGSPADWVRYTPFSRGIVKVRSEKHEVVWKVGMKFDGEFSDVKRHEVVAMALKKDESRLAVLYNQVYPNSATNYSSGRHCPRLSLRVFDTSDGRHITTTSMDSDRNPTNYFGNYANNHDLLYKSDGKILYNIKLFSQYSYYLPLMLEFSDDPA